MQTYMMLGRYEDNGVNHIGRERTRQAVGIIEELDGQVITVYGLLGEFDLAMIVNLPGNLPAMQASVQLRKITGIRFTTLPALSINRYDESLEEFPELDLPDDLDLLDDDELGS